MSASMREEKFRRECQVSELQFINECEGIDSKLRGEYYEKKLLIQEF